MMLGAPLKLTMLVIQQSGEIVQKIVHYLQVLIMFINFFNTNHVKIVNPSFSCITRDKYLDKEHINSGRYGNIPIISFCLFHSNFGII